MVEAKTTVRVDKIKKVKEETEKTEKEYWILEGKNADKTGKFQLQSPVELKGFKTGEVVDVTIKSSQMSLEEFKGEE